MFADIGRISTGPADPIWGLDQSFGVLHALDRLAVLPGFRATPKFEELHRQAEQLDFTRLQDRRSHYMANVKLADLEELRRRMAAPDGSEAKFILDNWSRHRRFTVIIGALKLVSFAATPTVLCGKNK